MTKQPPRTPAPKQAGAGLTYLLWLITGVHAEGFRTYEPSAAAPNIVALRKTLRRTLRARKQLGWSVITPLAGPTHTASTSDELSSRICPKVAAASARSKTLSGSQPHDRGEAGDRGRQAESETPSVFGRRPTVWVPIVRPARLGV